MNVIVVMPGRFHPFHKGHALAFRELVKRFGLANTFIAISAKQEQPRSPFSASERIAMAVALGAPKENVIVVHQPYASAEYIEMFEEMGLDVSQTALVFGVSKKDMEGIPEKGIPPDPRFSFEPKRDGSKTYLQPYQKNMESVDKHAYVLSTSVGEFDIAGQKTRDASSIRLRYLKAGKPLKLRILQDLYGNNAEQVKPIFDKELNLSESISNYANKLDGIVSPMLQESIDFLRFKQYVTRLND